MALERNVGGLDRIARAVVGVALVAVAVGAFLTARRGVATAAALAGAGLLFNAATQFCGLNALLGIDTCSRKQ
ncbi:YgaP-like transmembrane domain [Halorussus lipolyticus]|uniref:YgaP-like transmembrane domain n=1 Tax=Halorussus lipolyticus TaxID=3034024 RepID=UPI0023E872B6|nr:YgaP-like transmembrane domain [Halorussus sp. DT80]